MTQLIVGSDDPAPQGKGKIIFWSIGLLVLVGAGVAVYFFVIKKKNTSAPTPVDSQGALKDWVSKSGYVGSVDPVDCTKDTIGQPCKTKDSSTGACQLLKAASSPGAQSGNDSYECLKLAPGQAGWAATEQDCAKTCYGNGDFWALYNGKTNACVGRKPSGNYWDRCVPKSAADGNWTVNSLPDNQKDCDTDINVIQGVWKGIGDGIVPPTAVVQVNDLSGCQAETKARLPSDAKTYGVYDDKRKTCFVKTDDPSKNPFWECIWGKQDSTSSMYLVTDQGIDKVLEEPQCIPVAAIPVKGNLPRAYLREKPPDAGTLKLFPNNTDVGAIACLRACGNFDATNQNLPEIGPRSAVVWDPAGARGNCLCYDYPENEVTWKCQYEPEDTAPTQQTLYVRNDTNDPLGIKVPSPYSLPPCPHDPDGAGTPHDPDNSCMPPVTVSVCSKKLPDDPSQDLYQCAWNDIPEFIPMWGNASQCSDQPFTKDACISETTPVDCYGDTLRCGPDTPRLGGPCSIGSGKKNCPQGNGWSTVCYTVGGHADSDYECGACDFEDFKRKPQYEACAAGIGHYHHDECISGVCTSDGCTAP